MAEETVSRRLAAIVSADVVGYSRLMANDEQATLTALKTHRRDTIDPAIADNNGRIVKLMGDGMLIEFASVVDAVRASVTIQQAMGRHKDQAASGQVMEFRFGINVGEVVLDDGDIFGDGVNVAARL